LWSLNVGGYFKRDELRVGSYCKLADIIFKIEWRSQFVTLAFYTKVYFWIKLVNSLIFINYKWIIISSLLAIYLKDINMI